MIIYVKKGISIVLLVVFSVLWATPLLSASECNMDCCLEPVEYTCEMDMTKKDHCPMMIDCSTVIFVPVISAPINKVVIFKDLALEYIDVENTYLLFPIDYHNRNYLIKIITSEIHLGFQTPLLI